MKAPRRVLAAKSRFAAVQTLEIDADLLTFFIDVAALQCRRTRGLRDIPAMPLEFGKQRSTL